MGYLCLRVLGHTACVELLLSHGVNVDMEMPSIGTPLYCACKSKSTDCVQRLLISGQNHAYYSKTFSLI